MCENILFYQVTNQVCRITLNRPDVYHALSPELLSELTKAFQKAQSDSNVRVIVLTATGNKAFCSGADLKIGIGNATGMGEILRVGYIPLILTMRNMAKPIIARMNGTAVGAGCSLALACDLIVASENATMAQLFVKIGLIPDAGATFFLPRLIGYQKAFELASTGKTLSAKECQSLGLINEVVPEDGLDKAVNTWTDYYVQAPTLAVGQLKRLLNDSITTTLADTLEREAIVQDQLGRSEDVQEGLTAFLQKRRPNFLGK
ncbi:MAG: enoyl-CoA hydratase-related protein [Siphonobacter sp.]